MASILIILSAFLLYLSFPSIFSTFGINIFAWVFAIPLFVSLEGKKIFQRILLGLLFGVVFYALLVNWFINYNVLGYLLFVLVLMIQPVLFCMLYPVNLKGKILPLLYIPSLWVLSEYARTLLMQGFSWGLGFSQSFNVWVIQVSNILGASAISFIIIFVNYSIFRSYRDTKNRKFYITAIVVVFAFLFIYGFLSVLQYRQTTKDKPGFQVCAIQPNIDFRKKLSEKYVDEIVDSQVLLTKKAVRGSVPDLIIWPETSVPFDFFREAKTQNKMKQMIEALQTNFLIGAVLSKKGKDYNSALLLNSKGNIINAYKKKHLVPFSEYTPRGKFWRFIGGVFNIEGFSFSRGEKNKVFKFDINNKKRTGAAGVLICSEDTIGNIFRVHAKRGADFSVVLLNDGWLKRKEAYVLHAQNAIMHAVENKLPVLRVSNTGWTCLINAVGQIEEKDETTFNKERSFVYNIIPGNEQSFYSRTGNIFCLLCGCFVAINCLIMFFRRSKNEV